MHETFDVSVIRYSVFVIEYR